ncbi:NADH:flavin oxidoreductase/NADH oxidase family protein [Bradyrhizobium sp. Pear76]|uniref:NADH:flavin oxidoreductase/NADH oxidase family protein n=1 Tax=Bradyrhizobium oropedii TaxID=1571201 RepID=UPI001E4C5F2A|nr:NADH:flavin oxidoreductase/NADH oxidase family protein [Bradyrhizobium oropedii]MCC8960770.1 NADH:flavin oxidoreductase/NADH oxidase family protein [Bradyrhizobium oropedii]
MIETSFTLPCGLILPNRIVKAAMTEKFSDVDGHATPRHACLFERLAEGGAGMLITGNVVIDPRYLEAPGNVFIEDDSGLDALKRWAAAGKSRGVRMIMQLNHAGRQTPASVSPVSIAPSAVPLNLGTFFSVPRAMSDVEIEEVIGRFAFAASLAEKAGFDGVEIHAAHGYLISQFLSPRINKRNDMWGGSIANRARLLVRVVEAVRGSVSDGFAVGIKLNVGDFIKGGLEPEDSIAVARMLDPLGVDFIELSGGTHERAVSFGFGDAPKGPRSEAYFVSYARDIRSVTRVPLILTGGMRSAQVMRDVLQARHCDLIGMARPLVIEPDLPRLLLRGALREARSFSLKLPASPRANLLELLWSREQLIRIADGKAPKLNASPKLSLYRMLWDELGFRRRRARFVARFPVQPSSIFVALANGLRKPRPDQGAARPAA